MSTDAMKRPAAPVPAALGLEQGSKRNRLLDLAPLALGLAVAIGVGFPWLRGGQLWMLDWVLGPHQPLPPPEVYGLSGGLVAGLPFDLGVTWLAHLIGSWASVLVVLAVFPVAAKSAADLVGGNLASRLGAALLYSVNPFVFDRLYSGQIGVLAGYALLPWAVRSLLRLPEAKGWSWISTGLWWAALVGASAHFAWIFAVPVVGVALAWRLRPKVLARLGAILLVAGVLSSYTLVAGTAGGVRVDIDSGNLAAFATQGDPHLGLAVNVAGLYGFWRTPPLLAKQDVSAWPFLLAAILVVACIGFALGWKDRQRRRLAGVLAGGAVAGFFLAMGSQGPTGALYRWAFDQVPYFDIMREAEKFSCLLALGYAILFGWGLEWVVRRSTSKVALYTSVALCLALPLAYEPIIFGGLRGQVSSSHIPPAWQQANALMGQGSGSVLVFPWYEYLAFGYTGGREVANPAASLLSRNVVSGDNADLAGLPADTSQEGRFVAYLVSEGPKLGSSFNRLGALLAPIGVSYVLLEKTVDWRSYGWLEHQADLSLVLNTPTLALYRNDVAVPVGSAGLEGIEVQDWGTLIAMAEHGDLDSYAVRVRRAGPGPIALPRLAGALTAFSHQSARSYPASGGRGTLTVRQTSPTSFLVTRHVGWVQLAEPYQSGWQLGGVAGAKLAEGNLGWAPTQATNTEAMAATFRPWTTVKWGYVLSLASLACVVVALAEDWRRHRPGRRREGSPLPDTKNGRELGE